VEDTEEDEEENEEEEEEEEEEEQPRKKNTAKKAKESHKVERLDCNQLQLYFNHFACMLPLSTH